MIPILELAELSAIGGLAAYGLVQRQRIQQMRIDPTYGCLTRTAVETSPPKEGAIVFWDIDHMHEANERYGYQAVDVRIKTAIDQIRASRDCRLIARWYSGDELIYNCPTEDAPAAAQRVLDLFEEQGLSVTASYAVIGEEWHEAVVSAAKAVQAAKAAGQRGVVVESK